MKYFILLSFILNVVPRYMYKYNLFWFVNSIFVDQRWVNNTQAVVSIQVLNLRLLSWKRVKVDIIMLHVSWSNVSHMCCFHFKRFTRDNRTPIWGCNTIISVMGKCAFGFISTPFSQTEMKLIRKFCLVACGRYFRYRVD